jgi:hypothetical protein
MYFKNQNLFGVFKICSIKLDVNTKWGFFKLSSDLGEIVFICKSRARVCKRVL